MTSGPLLVGAVKGLAWAPLWVVTAGLGLAPSLTILLVFAAGVWLRYTRLVSLLLVLSLRYALADTASLTPSEPLPFVSGLDVPSQPFALVGPIAEPLVLTQHLSTSSPISKRHVETSGSHPP